MVVLMHLEIVTFSYVHCLGAPMPTTTTICCMLRPELVDFFGCPYFDWQLSQWPNFQVPDDATKQRIQVPQLIPIPMHIFTPHPDTTHP